MCLGIVDKTYTGRDKKKQVGWKIFNRSATKGVFLNLYRGGIYKSGLWHTAAVHGDNHASYEIGFHIYESRSAARREASYSGYSNRVVKKVEFTNPTARGREYNSRVVVARRMRIVSPR